MFIGCTCWEESSYRVLNRITQEHNLIINSLNLFTTNERKLYKSFYLKALPDDRELYGTEVSDNSPNELRNLFDSASCEFNSSFTIAVKKF